jgi:hypothetical protein
MRAGGPPPVGRRLAWWATVLGVGLLHGGLAWRLQDSWLGEGAAERAPKALEVTFVRELVAAAPPSMAPPPRPAPRVAPVQAQAASAPPQPAASAPPWLAQDTPEPPAPVPSEPLPAEPVSAQVDLPGGAAGPTAGAASAASAPPLPELASASPAASAPVVFDWPPSTRLSYLLTGNYRGPLYGKAQVDWLRQAARYQVRLTVTVYPVFERRMLSDGVLGPDGLSPRRFDQETDIPFQGTRAETVLFERDRIRLANGQHSLALPGAQDSASQFVQLSWLYLTGARRLAVGESVSFPLALPRRVGRWTYDVTEQVRLKLPLGEVDAFHLVPRKEGRKTNELSVEMWLAPSLQYLPVRIAIQQDAETHLQLDLEKPPLQAGAP